MPPPEEQKLKINFVLIDDIATDSYDLANSLNILEKRVVMPLDTLQTAVLDKIWHMRPSGKLREHHIWIWRPTQKIVLDDVNTDGWFEKRDQFRQCFRLCHHASPPLTEGGVDPHDPLQVHFVVTISEKPPKR